jgi:hypothetical protein
MGRKPIGVSQAGEFQGSPPVRYAAEGHNFRCPLFPRTFHNHVFVRFTGFHVLYGSSNLRARWILASRFAFRGRIGCDLTASDVPSSGSKIGSIHRIKRTKAVWLKLGTNGGQVSPSEPMIMSFGYEFVLIPRCFK